MRSSIDQVVDVLNGWKAEERVVAVIFSSPKGDHIKLGGVIMEASRAFARISSGDADAIIRFSDGLVFDWAEPKRDRTGLPEETPYDSFLQIRAPEFFCVLSALKLNSERFDM
jgi:hypothetical protein